MLQRILTGTVLTLMLVAVLYLGGWYFAVVAMLVLLACVYEELKAFKSAGHQPVMWPAYAAVVVSVPAMMYFSNLALIPTLSAACLCCLLGVMRREKPELMDVLVSVAPILTIALPGMCLFGLLKIDARLAPHVFQVMLLSMVFTIAVIGDTFAYFVGTFLKGPKLCPAISPKKTISGAVGGLFGGVAGALGMALLTQLLFPEAKLPPWWANLIVGVVGGIAGELGDLFASLVKRHCGVKDFSNIFPGHGGMLDRMDSILFTAVVVFCYRAILVSTLAP